MARPQAAAVLVAVAAQHLAGVALLCVVPLARQLSGWPSVHQLVASYNLASSCLDVMLLALVQVSLAGGLLAAARPRRERRGVPPLSVPKVRTRLGLWVQGVFGGAAPPARAILRGISRPYKDTW